MLLFIFNACIKINININHNNNHNINLKMHDILTFVMHLMYFKF